MSPHVETDTEARAVQVIARADQREKADKAEGKTPFVVALLTGLSGAADLNQNGRLTASELGNLPQNNRSMLFLAPDGEGDMVLFKQPSVVPLVEPNSQTSNKESMDV